MKRIIAIIAALMITALSLTGCFGMGNQAGTATADEAVAAEIATYDKDFEGLQ